MASPISCNVDNIPSRRATPPLSGSSTSSSWRQCERDRRGSLAPGTSKSRGSRLREFSENEGPQVDDIAAILSVRMHLVRKMLQDSRVGVPFTGRCETSIASARDWRGRVRERLCLTHAFQGRREPMDPTARARRRVHFLERSDQSLRDLPSPAKSVPNLPVLAVDPHVS